MTFTREDAIEFAYNEARLIDEGRFSEWYELFAEDGLYWIPLAHDHDEPGKHPSLMCEDRVLLKLRVERLALPRAHSLRPTVRCLHVLQRPEITSWNDDKGEHEVEARYVYMETQGERQVVLGAVARLKLVRHATGFRIGRKTVLLLNADAALPMVQLFV